MNWVGIHNLIFPETTRSRMYSENREIVGHTLLPVFVAIVSSALFYPEHTKDRLSPHFGRGRTRKLIRRNGPPLNPVSPTDES